VVICLGAHEGSDEPKQAARANQYRTGKLGPHHPLSQSSQLWIRRCCRDLSQDDEYPGADQHASRSDDATEFGQLSAPMGLANCALRLAAIIVIGNGPAFKEPTGPDGLAAWLRAVHRALLTGSRMPGGSPDRRLGYRQAKPIDERPRSPYLSAQP
jgi:hypothetical protein